MLSGKKRLLGKVKRLLVLLAAAVASAQSQGDYKPVLPKGDKADKYVAKPAADGYAAEILLPAGVEGQPEAFPLDPGLKSVVTVESLAGPDGKPRKAIVIFKRKEVRAGDHSLTLRLTMTGNKTVEYPIEITVPAVTLNFAPPKVLLTQTYYPLLGASCWLSQCSVSMPLTPADGDTWLTNLRAGPAEPFLKDANLSGGTLILTLQPPLYDKANPSSVPILTITANQDFARGESVGKLRILADQFEHPVPIPVTVQNKLTSLVLIPILILGLALGFLVRVFQEERIARKKVQIEIRRLEDEVEKYLAAYKDGPMQTDLNAIKEKIDSNANASTDFLKTESVKWKEAFEAAFTTFKANREVFLTDSAELYGILSRRYQLPADFSEPLTRARAALKALLELPDNNVSQAEIEKTRMEQDLMVMLAAVGKNWNAEWRKKQDGIAPLTPLLLPPDASGIDEEWNAANERQAKVNEFVESSGPSRDDLKSMLEAVHRNYAFWALFEPGLPKALAAFRDSLDSAMQGRGHETDASWLKWKQDADEVALLMVKGDWNAAPDRLRTLKENLATLIRGLAKAMKMTEEEQAPILADVDSNNFAAAIRALKPGDELAGGIEGLEGMRSAPAAALAASPEIPPPNAG